MSTSPMEQAVNQARASCTRPVTPPVRPPSRAWEFGDHDGVTHRLIYDVDGDGTLDAETAPLLAEGWEVVAVSGDRALLRAPREE